MSEQAIQLMQGDCRRIVGFSHGTILRHGTEADYPYIDSLRKKEGNALGFIPKDAYLSVLGGVRLANRDRWKYQTLWVTEDNGDLTGFCYSTFSNDVANIIQIVVQQDARRWHRALLMADAVEAEAKRRDKSGIKCRVAHDLESNFFWQAVGYAPITQKRATFLNHAESQSNRAIWLYAKHFSGLFANGDGE